MKTKAPTLLGFAILGLLRKEGLSGYRIRKTFEETAMGNYSSSPGTIYPALKRLVDLHLVEQASLGESGKKVYVITNLGTRALKEWLVKPIQIYDVEKKTAEILLRFAFMDVLDDKKSIIHFLTSLRDLLTQHISELEQFHHDEAEDLPIYGRLAFEQGIESAKATLKWCKRAILEVS